MHGVLHGSFYLGRPGPQLYHRYVIPAQQVATGKSNYRMTHFNASLWGFFYVQQERSVVNHIEYYVIGFCSFSDVLELDLKLNTLSFSVKGL